MTELPLDVWVMIGFSILAFFVSSIGLLIYTLRREERKMRLLQEQEAIDTYAPAAIDDLRAWIDAHPDDPDIDDARAAYRDCVTALRTTERHVYDWSDAELAALDNADGPS